MGSVKYVRMPSMTAWVTSWATMSCERQVKSAGRGDFGREGELGKLFAACDAEERLWYEFFLMTGMREQEGMLTYWSDVNFVASTIRVTHKPDRGWTPKAYKDREIPIPPKLAKKLKAWKAKADRACSLVFPTAGCNPKLNFLDDLQGCGRAC